METMYRRFGCVSNPKVSDINSLQPSIIYLFPRISFKNKSQSTKKFKKCARFMRGIRLLEPFGFCILHFAFHITRFTFYHINMPLMVKRCLILTTFSHFSFLQPCSHAVHQTEKTHSCQFQTTKYKFKWNHHSNNNHFHRFCYPIGLCSC